MNIRWIGSPSYTAGRVSVDSIICHWIVGDLSVADAVFTNASYGTSAHYAVGNTEIHQYVRETDTAYHAGNWNINQRSIGIEHRGGPNLPISEATYNNSGELIADIWRRYGIKPLRPHRDIIATQCPGTLDLNKLNQIALNFYNGGDDDMITSDDKDIVRIINSEVKGRDFARTHKGDFDNVEMGAWTGQSLKKMIREGWGEPSSETFRNKRNTLFASGQSTYEPVSQTPEVLYRKKG